MHCRLQGQLQLASRISSPRRSRKISWLWRCRAKKGSVEGLECSTHVECSDVGGGARRRAESRSRRQAFSGLRKAGAPKAPVRSTFTRSYRVKLALSRRASLLSGYLAHAALADKATQHSLATSTREPRTTLYRAVTRRHWHAGPGYEVSSPRIARFWNGMANLWRPQKSRHLLFVSLFPRAHPRASETWVSVYLLNDCLLLTTPLPRALHLFLVDLIPRPDVPPWRRSWRRGSGDGSTSSPSKPNQA